MDQKQMDRHLAEARLDVAALNYTIAELRGDPTLLAACEALTIAAEHPGIEARIHCKTFEEAAIAMMIIYSYEIRKRERGKWNVEERGLEIPNGSIVVVFLRDRLVRLADLEKLAEVKLRRKCIRTVPA